jgi:hypothetical protein
MFRCRLALCASGKNRRGRASTQLTLLVASTLLLAVASKQASFVSVSVCAEEASSRGDFTLAKRFAQLLSSTERDNMGQVHQLFACGAQCSRAAQQGDARALPVPSSGCF